MSEKTENADESAKGAARAPRITKYCTLCGNAPAIETDAHARCAECRSWTDEGGTLARAFKMWVDCGERSRRCCGSLSSDKSHLYFHGKYWDEEYPATKEARGEDGGRSVGVEWGVSFYAGHAATYYLRDFDAYADSEEYGDEIPYPADADEAAVESFWGAVQAQGAKSAEAAWNADLLSCENCGYHYCVMHGGCPCDDGADGADDGADDADEDGEE